MTWNIRYSRDGEDHLGAYSSAEAAIEGACVLIDQACDVHGIWTGDLAEAIGPAQIMSLYDIRSKSLGKR